MTSPPFRTDPSPIAPAHAAGLRARLRTVLDGAGGQFVRYAITGLFVTALAALVYWMLATWRHMPPLLANLVGYAVAVTLGYVIHSRWSFRGHGSRDGARTTIRFLVASFISLAMNSLWVQALTGWLHGPTWWPVVPIMAVTPVAMFWLNRLWVFE